MNITEEIQIAVKQRQVRTCDAIEFVNRLLRQILNNTDVVGRNRMVLIDLGLVREYLYTDRGGYKIYYITLTHKGEQYIKSNNIIK